MKILSAGDRVRSGTYSVRARFARSVLLFSGPRRALFVVDRSIGPGPLNLVLSDPAAFVPGDSLRIAPRDLPPRFDSSLPRPVDLGRLLRALDRSLPRHAPPGSLASLFFPLPPPASRLVRARDEYLREALRLADAGNLPAGVKRIRGCGEGLTPSGDDFLCGWMLACRLRGNPRAARALLSLSLGANPVSNAFLELSAAGRVNRPVRRLLANPSAPRVAAACAFGHTSGADLLCGLFHGLRLP